MPDDLYKTLNCTWTREIESLQNNKKGMKRKTCHFAWFRVEENLNTNIGDGEEMSKVRARDSDEIPDETLVMGRAIIWGERGGFAARNCLRSTFQCR